MISQRSAAQFCKASVWVKRYWKEFRMLWFVGGVEDDNFYYWKIKQCFTEWFSHMTLPYCLLEIVPGLFLLAFIFRIIKYPWMLYLFEVLSICLLMFDFSWGIWYNTASYRSCSTSNYGWTVHTTGKCLLFDLSLVYVC